MAETSHSIGVTIIRLIDKDRRRQGGNLLHPAAAPVGDKRQQDREVIAMAYGLKTRVATASEVDRVRPGPEPSLWRRLQADDRMTAVEQLLTRRP